MTSTSVHPPRSWWVGVVAGMASYIDAAAIVSTGIAFVIYQLSIGLSAGQIGVLSATLTLGVAIGAIVGGRLGDRFGRRSVFLVTMGMVVVGSTLLVFSAAFAPLLIGTLLVGLGTGADLPVSLATIAEAGTDRNRGKLVAFSQILWYAGILTTVGLSTAFGGAGRVGGQILFGHVGLVALIVFVLRLTIPESERWRTAHRQESAPGAAATAERVGLRRILTDRRYLAPFLGLLVFYTLVNLAANTTGQFGTYVAVNVVHLSVQLNSLITLLSIPVGMLLGLWFMRVVDTRLRMAYYVFGSIASTAGLAIPAIFGFSLATLILVYAGAAIGGSFAFEAIMKVWTQESFPTLLRASAQGSIIAVARFVAAGVALVTPTLLGAAQLMYGVLALVVAIGYLVGWLVFRRPRTNFLNGEEGVPAAEGEAPSRALPSDAPGAAQPLL